MTKEKGTTSERMKEERERQKERERERGKKDSRQTGGINYLLVDVHVFVHVLVLLWG